MSAARLEALHFPRQRRSALRVRFATAIACVAAQWAAWRRGARARRELLAADPKMLADLGVSSAQAVFTALESPLD
ncbi:MAG: DUF1127 domain-containing protein [Rhodospirillales bacterium]|nr:DUF1127 domain-containing protein [Rhodospirillales bacterium]